MRLKITLEMTSRRNVIPMNYQFYISSWIQQVLESANKEFAAFLLESKSETPLFDAFKRFSFDKLKFTQYQLWGDDRLFEINGPLYLYLGLDIEDSAINMMTTLFMDKTGVLGDIYNQIDFKVTAIEPVLQPDFEAIAHYKLQTPWVVSSKNEVDSYVQYLSPDDPNFAPLAIDQIVNSFNEAHPEEPVSKEEIKLQIIPAPFYKRQGYINNPGAENETRILGYLCDCLLMGPERVHKMVWSSGISEQNNLGFGWVQYYNNKDKRLEEKRKENPNDENLGGSQYKSQYPRRDDQRQGNQDRGYQRRDSQGYQGRDVQRSDNTGGYQRRDNSAGYQRRDNSGGYQRRDNSRGYQRRDNTGGYQRRDNSGGYQRHDRPGQSYQDKNYQDRNYQQGDGDAFPPRPRYYAPRTNNEAEDQPRNYQRNDTRRYEPRGYDYNEVDSRPYDPETENPNSYDTGRMNPSPYASTSHETNSYDAEIEALGQKDQELANQRLKNQEEENKRPDESTDDSKFED